MVVGKGHCSSGGKGGGWGGGGNRIVGEGVGVVVCRSRNRILEGMEMEVILDPRVVAEDAAHNPLLHVINYYTGRRRRLWRAQKQAVFMHHPPRLPTTAAPHPENQSLPHPHQSHCVTTRTHYLPLRPLGLPVPTRTPSNSSITLLVLAEQVCIFLPIPAAS